MCKYQSAYKYISDRMFLCSLEPGAWYIFELWSFVLRNRSNESMWQFHNVKLYQHVGRKCHNLSRDTIFKVNENFQTMEIWGLLQQVKSSQACDALSIYMIYVRFTSAKIICFSLQLQNIASRVCLCFRKLLTIYEKFFFFFFSSNLSKGKGCHGFWGRWSQSVHFHLFLIFHPSTLCLFKIWSYYIAQACFKLTETHVPLLPRCCIKELYHHIHLLPLFFIESRSPGYGTSHIQNELSPLQLT